MVSLSDKCGKLTLTAQENPVFPDDVNTEGELFARLVRYLKEEDPAKLLGWLRKRQEGR